MILLDFCSMPWWLPWILPFLLGLAIGWAIWGRYKAIVAEHEATISSLNKRIAALEADLKACHSHTAELEGDVALAKGKMREAEEALKLALSGGMATLATGFAGSAPGSSTSIYASLGSDNLQIIEGVGPKMEQVLKDQGIGSWNTLATKTSETLRGILDTYGDAYRIIDPSTWPQQAKLAAEGQFTELIALQKNLDAGKEDASGETDSKLEKVMVKLGLLKMYKKDDLKAIEGIGPKIEELLQAVGISTWADLAATSPERIQEILSEGGSRFSLADPGTWPKQAQLADEGKWDELKTFQDFLQGGK